MSQGKKKLLIVTGKMLDREMEVAAQAIPKSVQVPICAHKIKIAHVDGAISPIFHERR